MNAKYLFTCLIFVTACTKPSPEERFDNARHKVTHQALGKFTRAMRAKGYDAAGIGEGLDHSTGKQNYLKVVFELDQLPDVDFARKVEVETLQEFLHYINDQEGIQDYVVEYPFSLKFIHVGFISRNPEEGLLMVTNFQEEIYYDERNPDKPISPSIEVHRESYEDALRIIDQQTEVDYSGG